LAHISTDKPYYKPGEVVFIEVFVVDSITKVPKNTSSLATSKILDSFGKEVFTSPSRSLINGTIAFTDFRVPNNTNGGEYQVQVSFESYSSAIPISFRKIRIGTLISPNLFVTVDFDKNAYLPGETAEAKIKVRKPDGMRLPAGSSIAIEVSGGERQDNIVLSSQGEVTVRFGVPPEGELDVLTLSVQTYLGFS